MTHPQALSRAPLPALPRGVSPRLLATIPRLISGRSLSGDFHPGVGGAVGQRSGWRAGSAATCPPAAPPELASDSAAAAVEEHRSGGVGCSGGSERPRLLRRTGGKLIPFAPGRRPSPEGPEAAKPLSGPGGQRELESPKPDSGSCPTRFPVDSQRTHRTQVLSLSFTEKEKKRKTPKGKVERTSPLLKKLQS